MRHLLFLLICLYLLKGTSVNAQSYHYLFGYQIDSMLRADSTRFKYQIAAWNYCFKGDVRNALKSMDDQYPQARPQIITETQQEIISHYVKMPAIETILKDASRHRVFIINEAHHQSQCRAFMTNLLKGLKQDGYNYLGLEALNYKDPYLNQRGYPTSETGFYINDPSFANMIRIAHQEGFTIFGYEQDERDSLQKNMNREAAQAQNISKLVTMHPDARFVIYCGYDHVAEDTLHNFMGLPMAGRVKRLCNTDPFTVDQTTLSEKYVMSSAYHKLINDTADVVLKDSNGHYFTVAYMPKRVDCQVYHPDTRYIGNRPAWLQNAYFHFVDFKSRAKLHPPYIAEVYLKNERSGLPVDVCEIDNTNSPVNLLVRKGGKHKILLRSASNERQVIRYKD